MTGTGRQTENSQEKNGLRDREGRNENIGAGSWSESIQERKSVLRVQGTEREKIKVGRTSQRPRRYMGKS